MNKEGQAAEKITALREQLTRQFPQAHRGLLAARKRDGEGFGRTGFRALDARGLPETGVLELVSPHAGYGSGLVLERLLEAVVWRGFPVAVVDGRDALDAAALSTAVRERLLWLRCRAVREALKATDFLLRDGNVKHVFLDLQWNETRELRRVPNPWWFRLRHLVEEQRAWLLAVTPQRLLSSVQWRMELTRCFSLEALDCPRKQLAKHAPLAVTRQPGLQVFSEAASLPKAHAG